MLSTVAFFVLGLVLLVGGAELLVRGASTLARRLGIPSLIVGLTIVAFGTSAPELAVSTKAALAGSGDLAVGNVVGSNIFNVLFILGLSALIVPLSVARQLIRLDVPILIGVGGVVWLLCLDGMLSRVEGGILFVGAIAYTCLLIQLGRKESGIVEKDPGAPPKEAKGIAGDVLLAACGLVLLVMGARWLVDSSVSIAKVFGISEMVIGVTIVAAGTSLPEVATSVMAAIRGERDIAVGNVVGSNIFNLVVVLGGTAVLAPTGIGVGGEALGFDIPVMALVGLLCMPVFFSGARIARGEGLVLLLLYFVYLAVVVFSATGSAMAMSLGRVLLYGLLPACIVAFAIVAGRQIARTGTKRGPV